MDAAGSGLTWPIDRAGGLAAQFKMDLIMSKLANDTLPDNLDDVLGFAAPHDQPIPYMHRTRTYYQALGYERPYRWAQFVDVPFTALTKPLSDCKVALISTAAQYQPDKGDQGPWSP